VAALLGRRFYLDDLVALVRRVIIRGDEHVVDVGVAVWTVVHLCVVALLFVVGCSQPHADPMGEALVAFLPATLGENVRSTSTSASFVGL